MLAYVAAVVAAGAFAVAQPCSTGRPRTRRASPVARRRRGGHSAGW